jgi:ribosomal protein L40E
MDVEYLVVFEIIVLASLLSQSSALIAIVIIIVAASLLGILMLLLLQTRRKIKDATREKIRHSFEQAKICPKCNEPNPIDARFCLTCSGDLETKVDQVVCAKCGQNNSSNARFCRKCGKALS